MIAADVSGNGTITAYDASLILRYLVGTVLQFPVGDDWRFVPSSFVINETNWNIATDSINYIPLNSDQQNQDFKGIIYGDVSGNWTPTGQELLTEPKMIIATANVQWGEKTQLSQCHFSIPVQVDANCDIYAVELKVTYNPEIIDFKKIILGEKVNNYSFNYHLDQGNLIVALAGAYPITSMNDLLIIEFEMTNDAVKSATFIDLEYVRLNEGMVEPNLMNKQISIDPTLPTFFALSQNHPNSFNPETTIEYRLPHSCHVELTIYNTIGQEIKKLTHGEQPAGYHQIIWDGKDNLGRKVGSGIYLYQLKTEGFTTVKKMIMIQ